MRDVKDKANDYKTVTALSEFVVSMLPFVPKSKTFISKIPDKSKLSGYISTTAKTVKPNELANAIKTGASIGAVLSGGDTDLQGTIANATAGGLGGATLHEGGKVIKEGTKLVGKISDNVKTNIEKAKYINELKKNPDNWVYETETKPTGKMRGLGLSQTPEMKTETKRVFSPFVDVDNMKSGAYKERISKTDYKELGNKKNEVEIWKPNHELGESGELKQGSLYGNVSANGVVNRGGSARPLLVDKSKYTKNDNVYDNFVSQHKQNGLIEKSPEEWTGNSVEDAMKHLNMTNGQIKIKSPIEEISIYKSHLEHLITDNDVKGNTSRKKYLNRTIRTIQEPNIITKRGQYHNYIKLFDDGKIKPHLQIVKVKPDGNFYVTNFRPTKQQIKSQIIEGQIIYDLSSLPNTQSVDTNIITDNSETFKGGVEEDKYIGKKFFVGDKEEEIIGYDDNHKMYVGKPAYDWGGNNLYTKEHLDKYYLPENYNFEEDKARREKEKQEKERISTEKKIQKENEEKEYNDINGYADDKTPLQRGKILKTLNKRVWYKKINNGQPTTSKKAIEEMVEQGFKPKKETFYKTFKRNGERFEKEENKLVMMNKQGEFYKVNLTEFYYAKHLVNKETVTPEKQKELETKSNKYEDYGEKISGAKKDLWSSYKNKLSEKISNSADEITLSKAFPEPNYESLLKSGIDEKLLATIKAIRDSIPDKPRSKYQVSRKENWVSAVKVSRMFVNELISGNVSLDEFDNTIKTTSLKDKIDLYRKIGYPNFKNLQDYSIEFSNGYYIKDGKSLDKPASLYGLYKKTGKRTRHLINTFDTKEQAIERLKQELSNIDNTPKKKDVPLSVWKWQGEKSIKQKTVKLLRKTNSKNTSMMSLICLLLQKNIKPDLTSHYFIQCLLIKN